MRYYTLRKKGRSVDLGWDPTGFGTFYAQVRGDPAVDLRIGVNPRRTRSIDEFEAWLGPFGPLPHAIRLRLLRDQANETPDLTEEALLPEDLEARLAGLQIACREGGPLNHEGNGHRAATPTAAAQGHLLGPAAPNTESSP